MILVGGKVKINDILLPITGNDLPIGKPDLQSDCYNQLDEEIMKVGSLQHDEVDWSIIASNSITYLKAQCKDYKVLGYLVRYVLQTKDIVMVMDFLEIFIQFNKDYLPKGYPTPDNKTIKGEKIKALKLIISHFKSFVKSETLDMAGVEETDKLLLQFITLHKQLAKNKGLSDSTQDIIKSLENKKTKQTEMQKESLSSVVSPQTSSKTQAPQNTPAPNELSFNTVREIKLSYLKIADYHNQQVPEDTLGYRLRRYAMWHSIVTLPPQNQEGITQMTAIPDDRLSDYRDGVANTPSLALLKNIEKTLENSPFWIEGNYLASNCAKQLGYENVSQAIQQATTDFVNRFDTFSKVKFSNGYAFIPDEISQWLTNEKKITPAQPSTRLSNEVLSQCYQENGLGAVLKQIDEHYQSVSDIREKFNLRLEKAHYLIEADVGDIAKIELKELRDLARQFSIIEWEASFFQQIDAILGNLS